MIDILALPILAALLLSILTGPLGCFVVWQKMAYFGDTIAHSAIIGVALGLSFKIGVGPGMLLSSIIVAIAVAISKAKGSAISLDARLGIIAHGSLALGLLLVSLMAGNRINLFAILMGDILSVGVSDIILLGIATVLALGIIAINWKRLLLMAIDEDLATTDEINCHRQRLLLATVIAISIALGVQLVGALLISAMLIIPAAGARYLAKSPEAMAIIAVSISALSSLIGITVSTFIDVPVGPAIVTSALFFTAAISVSAQRHQH